MSATTVEWLAVALFFICFFGFIILESFGLNKKNQVPFGKAFSFSFATNTISISIGFFVSFVICVGLFMVVWDGSAKKLPAPNLTLGAAVAVAALFPIVLLFFAKRAVLRLFKMYSVTSPWIFSALSSAVFLVLVLVLPVLVIYFIPSSPGSTSMPSVGRVYQADTRIT